MRPKIFQIGFHKCGTRTLHRFFEDHGIPTLHWDEGRLARSAHRRIRLGDDPFADYPENVFFSDMEFISAETHLEIYKEFRYIYSYYPDAFYILNTRNRNDWMRSRAHHPLLIDYYKSLLDTESADVVRSYWAREWREHHADVRRFFDEVKGKLLVFDLDRHGGEELVSFLGGAVGELDPSRFGHFGKTRYRQKPARQPTVRSAISRISRQVLGRFG